MVSELSTRSTIRAGERSGAKFLIVCSTPLSNNEISLAVMGVAAPLARVATTFKTVDASEVGCERLPDWAGSVLNRQAAVRRKTADFHQTEVCPILFPGALALDFGRIFQTSIADR